MVRAADLSIINADSPTTLVRCGPQPIIGVTPAGAGDLSMYLAVTVDPVTAPARTARTVTAELTAGWRDWVDDAINAYVRRDSVHVTRWTVDFGDGSVATYPGGGALPDTLTTTHAYDAGTFDVIVTAHVTGDAYGAFFAPDGTPFERVVPFALDISNRASGVAALPIEYLPPVVTVGGSPSGTLPGGPPIPADTVGHAAIWWPRGLPCALFVRPIIATEGFMRSGGVVIGGGTTRLALVSLRRPARTTRRARRPPARIRRTTPIHDPVEHAAARDRHVPGPRSSSTSRRPTPTAPSGPRRSPASVPVTVIYSAVSQ